MASVHRQSQLQPGDSRGGFKNLPEKRPSKVLRGRNISLLRSDFFKGGPLETKFPVLRKLRSMKPV